MHNYGVHLCVFNRGHNLAHPVRRILGLRENGARDMESYNSVKSQLSKSALQQWRVKIALPSLRYLNGSKWNCLVSGWRPVENWCELFFDAIVRVLSSLSKGQLTPLLLDLFVPRLHKKTINTAPRLGTASFLDNSLKTRLKLCTFVGTPCSAEFWSSSLAKKSTLTQSVTTHVKLPVFECLTQYSVGALKLALFVWLGALWNWCLEFGWCKRQFWLKIQQYQHRQHLYLVKQESRMIRGP